MATATASKNELTIYQCNNKHCTLGSRRSPGRFTGGMTSRMVNLLEGAPEESLTEGEDFGQGICPVCGVKGTDTGEVHDISNHSEVPGSTAGGTTNG